jgi:hypothetical protein
VELRLRRDGAPPLVYGFKASVQMAIARAAIVRSCSPVPDPIPIPPMQYPSTRIG